MLGEVSNLNETIRYFRERQKNIIVLKYKYLLNIYYGKAKLYKYIRILSIVVIPIILTYRQDLNQIYQLLILNLGAILYVVSYNQLSKYKEKASEIHMVLDNFILEIGKKDEFKLKPELENEILKLELENLVDIEREHYTEKNMLGAYKKQNITLNDIKINIQKLNLIASYSTREKYIKFNILLLILFWGLMVNNLVRGIDSKNSITYSIGLIPIMLTIFNEIALLFSEKEKIKNILGKIENLETLKIEDDSIEKKQKIEQNLIKNQEFINLLRKEFVEIPTFIYLIYSNENSSIFVSSISSLLNIIKMIYKTIIKKLMELLTLIWNEIIKKCIPRKQGIYLEVIFARKKDIEKNQNLYEWYAQCILKEINWTMLEKNITEYNVKIIKVGSAFSKVLVEYDIDIHIYVQDKGKLSEIKRVIEEHFKAFEIEKCEKEEFFDIVIYLEEKWKLDIRVSSNKKKIDYECKGKKCLNNINMKKIKEIIYLKRLKKEGILSEVPSVYIYYLIVEKGLKIKKTIELINKFYLKKFENKINIEDYSSFKEYVEEELKWVN